MIDCKRRFIFSKGRSVGWSTFASAVTPRVWTRWFLRCGVRKEGTVTPKYESGGRPPQALPPPRTALTTQHDGLRPTRARLKQEKVQEQERVRLEAERAAQAQQKAKEDAVVREGAKLMQVEESVHHKCHAEA